MVTRNRCALHLGHDNQLLAIEDHLRRAIAADWQGANGNSADSNLARHVVPAGDRRVTHRVHALELRRAGVVLVLGLVTTLAQLPFLPRPTSRATVSAHRQIRKH